MKALDKSKLAVLTMPEEIKKYNKQIKFLYCALKYMLYVNIVNKDNRTFEPVEFMKTMLLNVKTVMEEHKVKIFINDDDYKEFCEIVLAGSRNTVNRNEYIRALEKSLPAKSRQQIMVVYIQTLLECSMQFENDKLKDESIFQIIGEIALKLNIKMDENTVIYIYNCVKDIYDLI